MANAAKVVELPEDVAKTVERVAAQGERVTVTHGGIPVAAIVSLADLRRLEALKSEPPAASSNAGPSLFLGMAGCLDTGESDVSSDKYRHLADAYATKP